MSAVFDTDAVIVGHEQVGRQMFCLTLLAPQIAESARPGQFVTVRCSPPGSFDPLLRRPMTIYRTFRETDRGPGRMDPGCLQIIYQVTGRGTSLMALRRPGDSLRLLGPLGNGFVVDPAADMHILVGGGTGIAALMMLALEILDSRPKTSIRALLGASAHDLIPARDDWDALGLGEGLRIWISRRGLYQELQTLSAEDEGELSNATRCSVYACGPASMLRQVAEHAFARSWACYVSLEERMACGVGACQNCVIEVRDVSQGVQTVGASGSRYRRVCAEGPVLRGEEVDWDALLSR